MSDATTISLNLHGNIAVISVASPPVNALSAAVRSGLWHAFQRAFNDEAAEAVVLICEGRTFFAGADISEFGKPMAQPSLVDLLAAIEAASKPVLAAIHGTALGGGLETALVCDFRLSVPSAKMGLPEVKLGLLPGAGGTQRLPRLIGAPKALEMVTSGTSVAADAALEMGLLDEIVPEGQLLEAAVAFTRERVATGQSRTRIRDREVEDASPELFEAFRRANARKFRGFEAPEAIIQCIEAAARMPFDEGMALERRLFEGLRAGTQSAAQRYNFFAERRAAKIPDMPSDVVPRTIARVGIVGAGTMGAGIAMNFLSAGMPTTIVDTSQGALDRGVAAIRRIYESSAGKGRITADKVEHNMALLRAEGDLDALAGCDLVIEAVYEDMAIKKAIFARLDSIAGPGAILASNTSYLDLDEIAGVTSRPQSVVGLHFFSPANVMRLLEIVRGRHTDPSVLATATHLAKSIGKIAVVSGVCYGFIGNRMLARRRQQADALIREGAMPWDVDRVLVDFGMPMGPFQISDLAGLDLGWTRETSAGATIRERLCEIDRRGQKTGAGFYDYNETRNARPSPLVEDIILAFAAEQGIRRRPISDEEILERCLYPMIDEGARILDEDIAYRASDIDVVWVNGYGWPVYRGGPMFHADHLGLAHVRDRLKFYQAQHGDAFAPAPLLEQLAANGLGFGSL